MSEPQRKLAATVIVTSDTCSTDPSKDRSGQFVRNELMKSGLFDRVNKSIVQDDKHLITKCLSKALDDSDTALIVTVGGTGLCPRDVTPEATRVLYERECTGIVAALHAMSLRCTTHAALSRLTSGIVGSCLIINFPGGLRACEECIGCVQGFLKHAIEQVRHDPKAIASTHSLQQRQQYEQVTPINRSRAQIDPDEGLQPVTDVSYGQQKLSTRARESSPAPSSVKCSVVENTPDNSMCSAPEILPQTEKPIRQRSPYALVDYHEALEIMGAHSSDLYHEEEVNINSFEVIEDLMGDVLALDEHPRGKIPEYSVSTMDGFILHIPPPLRKLVCSIKSINPRVVAEETFFSMREDPSFANSSFFCCRVNTGGRLPEADFAVIPVESTLPIIQGNILPIKEIKLDRYIRLAGSDMNESDVIKAGTRLSSVELATLLSMGCKRLRVLRRPRIATISTGDELADAFMKKTAGVIDINGPLLNLTLKSKGYYVENMGIVHDKPNEILTRINESLDKCDILLITGGASMGSKDYVKDVIETIGGVIHYGRVNIKPGKPAAFATVDYNERRKFVFSLPGNPVSAFVTTQVLVIPFIEHGLRNHFEPGLKLSLNLVGKISEVKIASIIDDDNASSYEFDGRLEFVRAKFHQDCGERDQKQLVTVSIKQQSSRMLSLLDCDCFVIIDPHLKGSKFHVGQIYQALILNQ